MSTRNELTMRLMLYVMMPPFRLGECSKDPQMMSLIPANRKGRKSSQDMV